jgi:thiamine kinase-like enzyme
MGLLREIPHPSIFGNVIGGSISHYLFYSPSGDKEICGPFNTEATFNAALINRIEAIYTDTGQHNTRANFYRRNLDRVLRGHSPTFSHSDLQKKNIIVLRKSSGDFDVGIIDWEDAGWFPCYWEYFIAFINLLWDDDWPEWIEHILSPYLSEAAVMKMVYNEIVF